MTERAIGRSKIRRKTVREYKSEDWMLNGFGLRRWASSGQDGLELSDLVAAQLRAAGWGSCALRNPPQNDQSFLGRLPELYDLSADPNQRNDIIGKRESDARAIRSPLIRFMEETGAARNLIESRRELRI